MTGKGLRMVADAELIVAYESPALEVLGTIHELTLLQDKTLGPTDGFTFNGIPIQNRVTSSSV
jgi:hypothetical protein